MMHRSVSLQIFLVSATLVLGLFVLLNILPTGTENLCHAETESPPVVSVEVTPATETPAPATSAPEIAAPDAAAPPDSASIPEVVPLTPEQIAAARAAAIQKVELPETIPNPSEQPAEAAALAQQIADAIKTAGDPKEVESPPEEEPVPLINYDPKKSFSQLLYPHIAERVGLSDEQKKQVNLLMVSRSSKLAKADKSKWNEIVIESEAALKALLTPQQLDRFDQSKSEKKIVLRFNKENWSEVLKWFAAEVGLQLVMDAPPPGTLNYSDRNAYDPKEALDILNGALQFRGYTLVRFGEMLLLHNFKNGPIPLQYLPKIQPDDIANQGRFDYVALTIPLENRSIETLIQVIKPFQGPNSYTRPMPGNSLLVVDSTNVLRQVCAAALAVNNPAPPAKPAPRAPGEVPEWRSFQLTNTRPAVVRDQVALFAPGAKSLINPSSNLINFLAVPSLLNVIDGLIKRLEEGADHTRHETVEIYSLESLVNVSPRDRFRMNRQFSPEQLDYYSRITGMDFGNEIVDVLKQATPDAKISLNTTTKKIIVLATPNDHKTVTDILERLKNSPNTQESSVLKVYRLKNPRGTVDYNLESVIRTIVPSAQITLDPINRSLLIVAMAKEHEIIAQSIQELESALPGEEENKVLAIYSMTALQRTRFNQIFAYISSTPDMRGVIPIADGIRNQLCIWARPQQQEQIRKIVEQISGTFKIDWENRLETPAVPSPLPATGNEKTGRQMMQEMADSAEPTPATPALVEAASVGSDPASAPVESLNPETSAPVTPAPVESAPVESASAPVESTNPETTAPMEPAPVEIAPVESAPVESAPAPVESPNPETTAPAEPTPVEAAPAEQPKPEIPASAEPALPAITNPTLNSGVEPPTKELLPLPGAPEGIFMAVIPLVRVNPSIADTLLINTIPGIEVTVDYYSNSVILCGTRSMLKAGMTLIGELETGQGRTFRLVPIPFEFPLETLNYIVYIEPNVYTYIDRYNHRVFLLGRTNDVLRTEKFVRDLLNSKPQESRSLSYLQITRDIPAYTFDYIRRISPLSEVSYDSVNRQFTIYGTEAEQLFIAKIITEAEKNLPPEQVTRFYPFDRPIPQRVIDLLREQVPGLADVRRDEINTLLLVVKTRPDQHEKVKTALETIQQEYPTIPLNEFIVYPVSEDAKRRFRDLQSDFERENGAIRIISNDPDQLLVWALPKQHESLKQLLDKLDTVPPKKKEVPFFYSPKHVNAEAILAVLREVYPEMRVTNDTIYKRLVIHSKGEDEQDVKDLLAKIDAVDADQPKRYFVPYSIRNLYVFNANGSVTNQYHLTQDLEKLVPGARVGYDYYSQQLIVWASEEEHQLVAQAVGKLNDKVDIEKALIRYELKSASPGPVLSLLAQIFPRVSPTVDYASGVVLVRLPNDDPQLADEVRKVLAMLDQEKLPQLKFYPLSAAPTETMISALRQLAPQAAMIRADIEGKQVMVIGTPSQQKTIEDNMGAISESLGLVAQKMIAYPIYGIDPQTLATSLGRVYPGTKVEIDRKGKRLLVWAALEDHVRISDEIAQVNGTDKLSADQAEGGMKVAVYQVENYSQATQFREIIQTLLPSSEVFSDPLNYYTMNSPQKVTVVTDVRSQKQIEVLFEQMRTPDSANRLELICYPFAAADPAAVESLLRGLLSEADSLSPDTVQSIAVTPPRYRNRDRFYNAGSQPFYRVDPKSKTVAVFAKTEDHRKVKQAVESLAALDEAQSKLASKVYTLLSPIASSVATTLRSLVPGATVTVTSTNELIVYANIVDFQQVDDFLEGVANTDLNAVQYQMRLVEIPEKTLYPRDRILTIMLLHFRPTGGYSYPGAHSNQIILWGSKELLDRMELFLNESFKVTNEEFYKTYPLANITPSVAVQLLQQACPNMVCQADAQKRIVTVFGTAYGHEQVSKALETLDQPRSKEQELITRYYNLDDTAPYAFRNTYYAIASQFPMVTIVPEFSTYQMIITATVKEHDEIEAFRKNFIEVDKERKHHLRVYYLAKHNNGQVFQILQEAAPRVRYFVGKTPNELYVWGRPAEQEQVREILSKLESVDTEKNSENFTAKVYSLDTRIATTAISILTPSVPGALLYPLAADRIIVWGSPADHETIGKLLGTIAEAYPTNVIKQYPLKHLRANDILNFVTRRFSADAYFYSSMDDDALYAVAPEVIQVKIAATIEGIDLPIPDDVRRTPVAYDISDVPAGAQLYAFLTVRSIAPEAIMLPSITAGYFVVYAKPSVQEKVASVIEAMLKEQPWLKGRLETYHLRNTTFAQVTQLLLPIVPNARFGIGNQTNQLIAWGKGADHEKIKDAIDKLNADQTDPQIVRIYRFEKGNLYAASMTLTSLFPQITCYPDISGRTLSVTATADNHEKVQAFVEEFDRVETNKQTSLQVFNLGNIDYGRISSALTNFFYGDPDFRVQYDGSFKSLIVQGTARQRETVARLIETVRQGGLADPDAVLKAYTIKNSYTLLSVRRFFYEQGKDIPLQIDYSTGKLIVFASPEEHHIVESLLETLAPEATILAVFNLQYVAPETAQFVISNMLESDGTYIDVQLDPTNNQLYIRGTAKKLEEIRRLLLQMGEKGLEKMGPFVAPKSAKGEIEGTVLTPPRSNSSPDPNGQVSGTGLIRTIRTNADGQKILDEVQKIWDRQNQLQVIKSDAGIIQTNEVTPVAPAPVDPTVPVEPKPAEAPQPSSVPIAPAPELPVPVTPVPAESPKPAEVVPVKEGEQEKETVAPPATSFRHLSSYRRLVASLSSPTNLFMGIISATNDTIVSNSTEPSAVSKELAPGVYAVLNTDGTITITSSDQDALDALQKKMLEIDDVIAPMAASFVPQDEVPIFVASPSVDSDTLGESTSKNLLQLTRESRLKAQDKLVMEGRDFSIYKIENVSVGLMLPRLQSYLADKINPTQGSYLPSRNLYRQGINFGTISQGPRITFSPDLNMNTLMVKGSRADRDEVGAMVVILDKTELFPQPITKPYKVRVRNMSVVKMAQQVLVTFQRKFMMTRLPGDQFPRISPNTTTSTLEIYAPEELAKEIEAYVKEMDEEIINDPIRKVHVVELKGINSLVLQKYLTNLRASNTNQYYNSPYMVNPYSMYNSSSYNSSPMYNRQPRAYSPDRGM